MEEPITDYSKILEMKMRWQLKVASEEAVTRNMQQYISQMQLEEGRRQDAPDSESQDIYQDLYQRLQTVQDAPEEKGNEGVDYKTAKAGYEAYRHILEEKEKTDKENAVPFDRKG